jgi:hypothetical protein
MTCNEIKAVIKHFPKMECPGSDGFSAEFYQTCKEKQISALLKIVYKIEREGTLPNSFYEASVTLIPKPDQGYNKDKYSQSL